MIDDMQLLGTITETADMGRDSLNHVLERVTDTRLQDALRRQYTIYDGVYRAAGDMLGEKGKRPQKIGAGVKLYSHLVSDLKTLTAENETSKIAEMVIEGSTMGVNELTKQLNAYGGSDPAVRALAERQIACDRSHIDAMKQFL